MSEKSETNTLDLLDNITENLTKLVNLIPDNLQEKKIDGK